MLLEKDLSLDRSFFLCLLPSIFCLLSFGVGGVSQNTTFLCATYSIIYDFDLHQTLIYEKILYCDFNEFCGLLCY